ncbi:hypothetical protein HanPSC8_Chr14g0628941 [Helianthus annuus]|nr:hypothetical protein HanPSC8_Chr14g0628941 [Helianthus annuus]
MSGDGSSGSDLSLKLTNLLKNSVNQQPKPTALNPKLCSVEMGGDSSSGGEEDGDAEWRAAIHPVTSTAPSNSSAVANGTTTTSDGSPSQAHTKNIKLYQIKAQKLVDDILEQSIKVVRKEPMEVAENHSIINKGGYQDGSDHWAWH